MTDNMQEANSISTFELLDSHPWLLLLLLAFINPFLSYLSVASSRGECLNCGALIILWVVPGFIFGLLPFQRTTLFKNILILLGLSAILDPLVRLAFGENVFDGLVVANLLIFVGWPIGLAIFALINKLAPKLYPFIFLKLPLWILLVIAGAFYITNYFFISGDFFEISMPIIGVVAVLLFIYRFGAGIYGRFGY